ncbi:MULTISPECIES: class II aldolase/adducin family protein [Streptomyces]|uniref:Aldolase n=2 Tax=Streptomyces diastaticus group TaxID=2849069 RepID=A0A8H9HSV9_9ACTN|nr:MULTISPECIES: class II aldolase/adducin family protein [Streptomyces]NEE59289.1 class II aldolase/adducin family protein [Streptomyces sp. SID8455]MBL3807382.1 class II aldolase/adducin family protein [Streptomyces sp. BRB081]NEC10948.1 class II aldolase/adducin family protein [Streptomyces sp. SID8014]PJM85550.1 fuculose phosphate aldolase [Streptomyces sp. TSRI0384-2]QNE80597.1 class II aldolase/adducin family protein [Streptomyces rutgersensis]
MEKNFAHPGRAWRLLEDRAVARAWHDLLETARATLRDGLVAGTSGNVSVRVTPDRPAVATDDLVLITPTGVPYDRLGPEDAVAVTLDGRQVLGTLEPTSELPLHLAVHRSGTARAVVHTHAPHATAVSTLVDTLPPVHYMAAALGGPVRTAPYALYGTEELAGHLLEALRDRTACLLRNHGTVTTGDTLAQALDRTVQLEWMCRVWLLARSVPGHTPSLLDADQLAAAADRLRGYGQPGG